MNLTKHLLTTAILIASAHTSLAQQNYVTRAQERIVVGQTYTAKARYSIPLTSFDRCVGPNPAMLNADLAPAVFNDRGTVAGQEAYYVAAKEALAACKNDMNADCKIISAVYRDFVSTDFVGFKACDATIIVHGYRLK